MDLSRVIIETPRLRIIPNIDEQYAKDIFQELTSEITAFMSFYPPKDISDTLDFIRSSKVSIENGTDMPIIAFDKETREFIGCGGIHHVDSMKPSLGIWVKKSAHGKGYGKEIIAGLIDWTDKNINYEYITYHVAKANAQSRKLIESLDGVVVEEGIHPFKSGKIMDAVVYRIYRNNKSI